MFTPDFCSTSQIHKFQLKFNLKNHTWLCVCFFTRVFVCLFIFSWGSMLKVSPVKLPWSSQLTYQLELETFFKLARETICQCETFQRTESRERKKEEKRVSKKQRDRAREKEEGGKEERERYGMGKVLER
jgi:hypothetical protein